MSEDLVQDNLARLDDEQIREYAEMAQARIEELEAALRKSAVQHNDFDDGSGGCIARALGDNDE